MLKIYKILIIIISLVFIQSSVFAACSVTANYNIIENGNIVSKNTILIPQNGSENCKDNPEFEECAFLVNISQTIVSDLKFTKTGCGDKNVVVYNSSSLDFKIIDSDKDLEIKGNINELRYISNASTEILVDVKDGVESSFFINITLLTIQNNAFINMEDIGLRNHCDIEEYAGKNNLIFNFKTIEISSDGALELSIIPKEPEQVLVTVRHENANGMTIDLANVCLDATHLGSYYAGVCPCGNSCDHGDEERNTRSAGDINFYGNKLINYGIINLNFNGVKAQKGIDFVAGVGCSKKKSSKCVLSVNGGSGGQGSNIFITLDVIENYSNLTINGTAGDGGDGGQGRNQSNKNRDKRKDGTFGTGGHGGSGGNIFFDINRIGNFQDAVFDIQLYSGNGGLGGNTGLDTGNCDNCSNDKYAGDGGQGGYIGSKFPTVLNKITTIVNDGVFKLNQVSGNGGTGGDKLSESNHTFKGGSGAIGGNIRDLNISYLNYTSDHFEIIQKAGETGVSGQVKVANSAKATPGNIYINNLKSGSNFPNILKLQNPEGSTFTDRKIVVKGCYINKADALDIETDELSYYINNDDSLLEKLSAFDITLYNASSEQYCPPCEQYQLDNDLIRVNGDFSLYSNLNGTLKSIDIYYANQTGSSKYFVDNPMYLEEKPVFKYIEEILSDDSELERYGLYKYTLDKEKLIYFGDWWKEAFSLTEDNSPYCLEQQYYAEGIIKLEDGTTKDFSFPFTPIFRVNGD